MHNTHLNLRFIFYKWTNKYPMNVVVNSTIIYLYFASLSLDELALQFVACGHYIALSVIFASHGPR